MLLSGYELGGNSTRKGKNTMKKTKRFLALIGAMLLLLCGCAHASGTDADALVDEHAGVIYYIPQAYQDKGIQIYGGSENIYGYRNSCVFWQYIPEVERLFRQLEQMEESQRTASVVADFYAQMNIHTKYLLDVTVVEEDVYDSLMAQGGTVGQISLFPGAEAFGRKNGFVYLVALPENDTDGMSQEEKALYEECSAYVQTIKNSLELIRPTENTGLPSQMPAFTAKDLNGNTVTNDIFAQKELTVINIWGTFCGPCIGEMPELGQWAGEMPDNVQLIGLVTDISGENDTAHVDLAKQILEKAGADFVNLIPGEDFQSILGWVTGVPTTLFVDSQGNLVGEPIIGADVAGYKSFVEEYLNEH